MPLFQQEKIMIKGTAPVTVAETFPVRRIADKNAVFTTEGQFLQRQIVQKWREASSSAPASISEPLIPAIRE